MNCLLAGIRLTAVALALPLLGASAIVAAQEAALPLPEVTVQAHVLAPKARRFVMNVTAASGYFMDEPVQLWRRPVCPLVAGLAHREGQYVFDQLDAAFASVRVARGETGCHPNFFFIVTTEPKAVLNGAWDRNWHLFNDASPTLVRDFIGTERPVRVWYNTILSGKDGPAMPAGAIPALASDPQLSEYVFGNLPTIEHAGNGLRSSYQALNDLMAVIVIVNPNEVQGLNWAQVADYAAMVGLTRISPDVDPGDTPSILHLFTAASGSRPAGLSDWDRAFLKALYVTDPALRSQRFQVSHLMERELAAPN